MTNKFFNRSETFRIKTHIAIEGNRQPFLPLFFYLFIFLLVNGVAESEFKHFSELIHYMSLFFLCCSSESGTNDNQDDEDYEEPSNYYSDDDRPSDDDLYIK